MLTNTQKHCRTKKTVRADIDYKTNREGRKYWRTYQEKLNNKASFSERLRTPNEKSNEREGCAKYEIIQNDHLFVLFATLTTRSAKNIEQSVLNKKQVEFYELHASKRDSEFMKDFTYFYIYRNELILLSKQSMSYVHIKLYLK